MTASTPSSVPTHSLFPVFLDFTGKTALVIGGGEVAKRKVQALLNSGADILVIAPEIDADLQALAHAGQLRMEQRSFDMHHLDQAWFVIAATDDAALNAEISEACNARKIWVNVVDAATLSSVHSPARIRRGPLQIAISSGGVAPMLARHLRERLETQFDDAFGELADIFAELRDEIRQQLPNLSARRAFFDAALQGEALAWLRAGERERVLKDLRERLRLHVVSVRPGRVALVGAGPGDAGLLTLRALRLLNQADVILSDQLVSAEVLELARRDAEVIFVGKRGGGTCTAQERIHELMRAHAEAGKFVVRLKGGDPFVFGRGGEELQYLRAQGIAYEVVPGITAAVACAAYAGISLTHRDLAQSVRFVTAHCKNSLDTLDWSALAQERQTLAVYMGVSGLAQFQQHLLAHGRAPSTPFALIENGTRRNQRVLSGTLAELYQLAEAHHMAAPSLLLIGEVATQANALHWFGAKPLGASKPFAAHGQTPALANAA